MEFLDRMVGSVISVSSLRLLLFLYEVQRRVGDVDQEPVGRREQHKHVRVHRSGAGSSDNGRKFALYFF